MCAKKKTAPNKTWKLAGEPIYSSVLTSSEREEIAQDFALYRKYRSGEEPSVQCVTPAVARVHESAAQAVAGFLCQHYAGRFERESVLRVTSASASVPMAWTERIASHPDFLMGATLWLLDYLEDACEDEDEYLDLLPLEADVGLEYNMPCIEDLEHPQETIIRMATLLEGREKAYRKEFRSLVSLIDPDTAERLRRAFRDSFLDYMDRAIEIYDRMKPATPELPPAPLEFAQMLDQPLQTDRRKTEPEIFFLFMAPRWICMPEAALRKGLHSRRSAELLAGYGADAPYELCAAHLLLEREGDALANLNALTAVVLICATRHLPWVQDDFGARGGLFQRGTPSYRLKYEYSDAPDEYGEEPMEMERLLSEAQLFFLATGVVLPRGRMPSDKLAEWFMRQGVEEQRAHELAWAAFMAYYVGNGKYGWKDFDLFDDDEREENLELPANEPEETSEAPDLPAADGESDARVEELTRKVKELRSGLHDAERTCIRLREQLRETEQRGEMDRSELAQLRETLYSLRAREDESKESSGPLVELPWQVKRRVVVFGGHDSWRKAVKPLLPGARFYDREVLPDLNAVRGADVVWLQVNALSHKYYYRIIDAARKNGIQVRYFDSASAKKCAVQLALDELVAEKSTEV